MLVPMISICNYFLKILVLNPKDGGDIQEIIDACIAADQAAKLAKMNEN